ncbi:MAG: hypothetical protein IPP71_07280 [Bacteroidetes bacterium]|nr:hypothetical protein [Bacteroidota bacterium]
MLQADEPVLNGIKQGLAKYYSETGLFIKEVNYDKGVENGIGRAFAEDGRIISLLIYKNGYLVKDEKINRTDKFNFKQGVWKEFYPDQKTKTEANYKDDKLEGPFKYYSTDGTIKKMEVYKNGELVVDKLQSVKLEIKRDYHNNGRPKSSVNLIDGKKQGVYREYSREGVITSAKMFRNDNVVAEGLVDESMLYQALEISLS